MGLLLLVLLVVLAELTFRVLGYQPWQPEHFDITTDPAGGIFQKDSLLGFKLKPGDYDITLPDGYTFTVHHSPEGHRLTEEPDKELDNTTKRKTVWVLGGSYTYGWSISDRETFLWQAQKQLPEYEFVNMGVPAYGTLQCYQQLNQALIQHSAPDLIIYVYAGFHDMRNVNARMWNKTLAPYNQLGPLQRPVASIVNDTLTMIMQELHYQPWPLQQHLAMVHALEIQHNALELQQLKASAISIGLVSSMRSMAEEFGSRFALATIVLDDRAYNMIAHCQRNNITTFDMTVDTRLSENTNLPHDSHPSAKANEEYARKLVEWMKGIK